MDFLGLILKLTDRFYPSGRAFKIFSGSWKESFYKALSMSESRAYSDARGIFNSILPDNDLFSVGGVAFWERRLGVFGNENSLLEERKQAIFRKINHPGEAKARQHFLYIQGQLQKAGFNVFLHENIFQPGSYAKNPIEIVGTTGSAFHSENLQHGQTQLGRIIINIIANSIDQKIDDDFVWQKIFTEKISRHSNNVFHGEIQHTPTDSEFIESNYRNMFYIGGEVLGTYATIPKEREIEFRSLVLSLKPVQNIGVLLINYI